jgi:rRNA processing protein Gar1
MPKTLTLLGDIINKTKDKVVVKTSLIPKEQELVYNENGEVVGKINKIYGPVSNPYINVSLTNSKIKDKIYVGDRNGRKEKR